MLFPVNLVTFLQIVAVPELFRQSDLSLGLNFSIPLFRHESNTKTITGNTYLRIAKKHNIMVSPTQTVPWSGPVQTHVCSQPQFQGLKQVHRKLGKTLSSYPNLPRPTHQKVGTSTFSDIRTTTSRSKRPTNVTYYMRMNSDSKPSKPNYRFYIKN